MEVGPVDVYIIGFPGQQVHGPDRAGDHGARGQRHDPHPRPALRDEGRGRRRSTTLAVEDLDPEGAGVRRRSTSPSRARSADEDADEVAEDLPAEQLGARSSRSRTPGRRRSSTALAAADAVADRLDPHPRRRRRRQRSPPAEPVTTIDEREEATWDFCAWPPEPPSSRAPRPPCPGASRAGRTSSRRRRTSSSTTSSSSSTRRRAAPSRAGAGRPDRQAPEPGAAAQPGRAHGRGVRGRQGQDPGHLTVRRRTPVEATYSRLAGVYDEIVVDPCHGGWAALPARALAAPTRTASRRPRRLLRHRARWRPSWLRAATGSSASTRPAAMLARARRLLGPDATLIHAALPDLPLEATFDAAVSTLDGFNYLTPAELRPTVEALGRVLRPAGWLVFDVHTDAMMALHLRSSRRLGRASWSPVRDPRRGRPGRALLRHPDRGHGDWRGIGLQRTPSAVLPPGDRYPVGACGGRIRGDRRQGRILGSAGRRVHAEHHLDRPSAALRRSGADAEEKIERRLADSNCCKRLCRPLPNHSAKAPEAPMVPAYDARAPGRGTRSAG